MSLDGRQVIIIEEHGPGRATIFHKRGDMIYDHDRKRPQWYTGCGFTVGWFDMWLRRHNAEMFARPCKRCFPREEKP